MSYFSGFQRHRLDVGDTTIHALSKGDGPPLLLLHGFPETHLCWWKIAPQLAQQFTVVVADLRGYGESGLPHLTASAEGNCYDKRSTAADMVALMRQLGFETFGLVGHDRGARVAHRLCLDHTNSVSRVAFLDIIPSLAMAEAINHDLALAYFHQYLLAQQAPFPETLFASKEAFLIAAGMGAFASSDDDEEPAFPPDILAAYTQMLEEKERFFAICEDYRAAAGIDLQHDREDRAAGRKVVAPSLVVWGSEGRLGQVMDVEACWKDYLAGDVQALAVECGHFLPEEAPDDCYRLLSDFFSV